jgi:hypothetical protein
MVQLKPEIYRLIVKALISSDDGAEVDAANFPAECIKSPSVLAAPSRKRRQGNLVSLMQVSKVSMVIHPES